MQDQLVKVITRTREEIEKLPEDSEERKVLENLLFTRRLRLHELLLYEKAKKDRK